MNATDRTNADAEHQDGQDDREPPIRVLFVKAPRCPRCGSHRLLPYGKVRSGPKGTVAGVRYTRCEQCRLRVHINIS
jgi:DNA-directed RNA polymerase subunit RPC12/RpoP